MDFLRLSSILDRQFEETSLIDQAFVELSTSICFSLIEREFGIALPGSYPTVDLKPESILSTLRTGKFSLIQSYHENLDNPVRRNEIAAQALGPAEDAMLIPNDLEINIHAQELGRLLVLEAEQLCLELDDRPIVHILATEIQAKASELWYTPIPRFCVIDSKYGKLRASGIFGASHHLAENGLIDAAKNLIGGLYDTNPRPTLDL